MEPKGVHMKNTLCLLCILLLISGTAASEKSGLEMLERIYDGLYQSMDPRADSGVFATDYTVENAYGVFHIPEVYYEADVVRYVVTATPKDPSVRFVWSWADAPQETETLHTYRVFCLPVVDEVLSRGYDVDYVYRDGQFICCYTFVRTGEADIESPFPLDLFVMDSDGELLARDTFEIALQSTGLGCSLSLDINEWMGGVFVESIRISAGALDLACVVRTQAQPVSESGARLLSVRFSQATGDDSGGASPSDGYAYCVRPAPDVEMLSFSPLIIRYRDTALVVSMEDGPVEWVDFHALQAAGISPLYLVISVEE